MIIDQLQQPPHLPLPHNNQQLSLPQHQQQVAHLQQHYSHFPQHLSTLPSTLGATMNSATRAPSQSQIPPQMQQFAMYSHQQHLILGNNTPAAMHHIPPNTSHQQHPQIHCPKYSGSSSQSLAAPPSSILCSDSSDNDDDAKHEGAGHGMDRKRRRGIIEKRRRDRINNSLIELKRLVPSAYDKQGSSKLEKAEILQLTVEHLKHLHQSGFVQNVTASIAQQKFEAHSFGFRDCMNELMRYLTMEEGLDPSHPLHSRLLRHLHATLATVEHHHALLLQHQQQQLAAAAVAANVPPSSASNNNVVPPANSTVSSNISANSKASPAPVTSWSQQKVPQPSIRPPQQHSASEAPFNFLPNSVPSSEMYDNGAANLFSSYGGGMVLGGYPYPHSYYANNPHQHPVPIPKLSPNTIGSQPTAAILMKLESQASLHQHQSTPPDNSSSSYLDLSGGEGSSFFTSTCGTTSSAGGSGSLPLNTSGGAPGSTTATNNNYLPNQQLHPRSTPPDPCSTPSAAGPQLQQHGMYFHPSSSTPTSQQQQQSLSTEDAATKMARISTTATGVSTSNSTTPSSSVASSSTTSSYCWRTESAYG